MTERTKQILKIIGILYIAFTLVYFGYTAIATVSEQRMDSAYQQGQHEAILQILDQATDEDCQPIYVYAGDVNVELINTSCITND